MLPQSIPDVLVLVGTYVSSRDQLARLPVVDALELAWGAGFFDGEGCTYLAHHGTRRFPAPATTVVQTEPSVMLRYRAAVGGIGYLRDRPARQDRRKARIWEHRTHTWRDTQALLTLLWPYLSEPKRLQAAQVFRDYQACVAQSPNLGRPSLTALWSADACPLGHTDIYNRPAKEGRVARRCRICRREGTQSGYRDVLGRPEHAVGERNGAAKLTAPQVRAIRTLHEMGALQKDIALEFGVSKQLVSDIVLHRHWRHID